MNTDPKKSATYCGCDEGANHPCERHQHAWQAHGGKFGWSDVIPVPIDHKLSDTINIPRAILGSWKPIPNAIPETRTARALFPNSAEGRKAHPIFTGVLMYFPDAIAAVAHVSKLGNDQHNPGQPLHWARGKSTDQTDTATRHMMDHGVGNTKDTDGTYHLAKAAWRILAELQLTIERERTR